MWCAILLTKTGVTAAEKNPHVPGSLSDNFIRFETSRLKARIYTALGPGFFIPTFFTGNDVLHMDHGINIASVTHISFDSTLLLRAEGVQRQKGSVPSDPGFSLSITSKRTTLFHRTPLLHPKEYSSPGLISISKVTSVKSP